MPGAKVRVQTESAGGVDELPRAQSAKKDGPVTRSGAQPAELLEILTDLLVQIANSGTEIQMIEKVYQNGRQGVGILVIGTEVLEGKIKRLPEPLPE